MRPAWMRDVSSGSGDDDDVGDTAAIAVAHVQLEGRGSVAAVVVSDG